MIADMAHLLRLATNGKVPQTPACHSRCLSLSGPPVPASA